MARDTRALRLKAVWLLVLPFLWYSRPTLGSLLWGAPSVLLGLLIRAWAAGSIRKDEELATSGPYAYVRHPLYVGSLFVGLGITGAGGHWSWPLLFLAFYAGVYGATMAAETELLAELFGDDFHHYAAGVPGLVPRLAPYRDPRGRAPEGFRLSRYRRNNEWEALLAAVGAYGFLAAKVVLG